MSPHEKDGPGDVWPITYRFADSKVADFTKKKKLHCPQKTLKECRENQI